MSKPYVKKLKDLKMGDIELVGGKNAFVMFRLSRVAEEPKPLNDNILLNMGVSGAANESISKI